MIQKLAERALNFHKFFSVSVYNYVNKEGKSISG